MSATTTTLTEPDALADTITNAVLAGKGLRRHPNLGPVSEEDRRRLQRITGDTAEQFNARITEKLRVIADKVAARIEERLDADGFKSGELAFVLTSSIDKIQAISGRSQLTSASVNIQVNNYGAEAKTDLMASLFGNGAGKEASVEVETLPLPRADLEVESTPETAQPGADPA